MSQIMLGFQAATAKLLGATPVLHNPMNEAQKAIQKLAVELKGVEGKYGFFSIALVRLKNLLGLNTTDGEKVQLEFFTLCGKVNKIATQHLKAISKLDTSNADSVREHDEAVVNLNKELTPLFQRAVELAVKIGSDRATSIEAVKLAFAQETSHEIGKTLNESLTVSAAVGTGTTATVQSTVALLSDVATHIETLAGLNPGTDPKDIQTMFIGTAARTPGMAQSILGAIKEMHAQFDAACVREATPQEEAAMQGHFMTELNKLLNGDQKITADSLKSIQHQGLTFAGFWKDPVLVAGDLEQMRGERAALAEIKRLEADKHQLLGNTQTTVAAVRADLAKPVEFTLEDFSKVVSAPVQAEISNLIGVKDGKTIAQALLEMTQLADEITQKSAQKDAAVTLAVQGQKDAADQAAAALAILPTPEAINREIADAKQAVEVKKGVIEAKKQAEKQVVSELKAKGDAAAKKAIHERGAANMGELANEQKALQALQATLQELEAGKAGKLKAHAEAQKLADDTKAAYESAKAQKDQELSQAIVADTDRLKAMKAQKYDLTGNQLVDIATRFPDFVTGADTISGAARTANDQAKRVKALDLQVVQLTDEERELQAMHQQMFDASRLKTLATLDGANRATLQATYFDAELIGIFKEDLTDVLRTQAKEKAVNGIVMGKRILAEVAALSVERYSTTAQKDARNEPTMIVTSPLPGGLKQFEDERAANNLSIFNAKGEEIVDEFFDIEEETSALPAVGDKNPAVVVTEEEEEVVEEAEEPLVIDATPKSFVGKHPVLTTAAVALPTAGGLVYLTGAATTVATFAAPYFAQYVVPYIPAALASLV